MFTLSFFSNQTFIPQFLPQLNKRSCSIFSPTKQTLPSASSPTKQALALNLFSNQTNVRPRFLFLLSKIRGQGQEGVGNLGGASDWASRGEVLCVIRGAPWVSDRCPRRAPGWEAPCPGRAAVRAGHYQLQACQNPIPPKAANKPRLGSPPPAQGPRPGRPPAPADAETQNHPKFLTCAKIFRVVKIKIPTL